MKNMRPLILAIAVGVILYLAVGYTLAPFMIDTIVYIISPSSVGIISPQCLLEGCAFQTNLSNHSIPIIEMTSKPGPFLFLEFVLLLIIPGLASGLVIQEIRKGALAGFIATFIPTVVILSVTYYSLHASFYCPPSTTCAVAISSAANAPLFGYYVIYNIIAVLSSTAGGALGGFLRKKRS